MVDEIDMKKMETIKPFVKGENILDVGSYRNKLHELLKLEFPKKTIIGLDIKKNDNVDLVVDLNSKKYSIKNESYDCIVASEVIEHLSSPFDFLNECHRILKYGGYLIITTPSIHSILYILNIIHNDSEDQHVYTWNFEQFNELVKRTKKFSIAHSGSFNLLIKKDFWMEWITKLFPITRTNLVYVLEKTRFIYHHRKS